MGDMDFVKATIDRVSDVIDEAVKSNDYSNLSNQIGGLMKNVTNTAASAAGSFAGSFTENARRSYEESRKREEENRRRREEAARAAQEKARREQEEALYFERPGDSTGSKILAVLGGAGLVVFGLIMVITMAVSTAAAGGISGILNPFTIMAGLMTLMSAAMTIYGSHAARKTEHFKTYRKLLLRKKYANISDISKETGIPEKVVLSELKEFSERKMIKQGHFDNKKTCFIASDSLYNDYLRTQQHAEEMKAAEAKRQKDDEAVSPEVRELLDKGNEYIRMIREANDRIPGEEVTAKLDRMEMIVRKIFEEVRKRPELAGSLNMFMNYYLPTTTKLINAYEQMAGNPVQGENITAAKREIENSLDTICDAYETLLDSFFRDTAMDVSSDINVMKMMMKQDGLTADDFTKMQNGQAAASKTPERAGAVQAAGTGSGSTASAAQAMAGGQALYEEKQ